MTCRCSPTPVLMQTLSENPRISNFDFQAALSANSSFWRFNLTTVRDALPAQYKPRANAIVRTPHNVLSAHRGRVLPIHSISDEIAAQLHAFNEAKKLQNNLTTVANAATATAQSPQATAGIEADSALNSVLLEIDASIEAESSSSSDADAFEFGCSDQECVDEVRAAWLEREARSVDDIVNELHAMIAEETRGAAAM